MAESHQQFVRATCPGCGSQLRTSAARIGRRLPCPKCGQAIEVRAEPPGTAPAGEGPPNATAASAAAGKEYAVTEDMTYAVRDPGPQEYFGLAAPAAGAAGAVSSEKHLDGEAAPKGHWEQIKPPTERPKLPPHPMVDGVFVFFWQLRTIVCWTVLSVLVTVNLWILSGALLLGSASGDAGLSSAAPWIGSMVLIACLCVLSLISLVVASANLLAILQDSAAGNDRIENWPDAVFVSWLTEVFYLITSLTVPAAVAILLASLLGGLGWWLAPMCFWLFFPIVLLSTLEMQSPLVPLSPMVLRSLWNCGPTWGVFLLETGLMGLGLLLLGLGFYKMSFVGFGGMVVLGGVGTTVAMLYFRLLGRLAWVCDERFRELLAEEEEEEEPDEGEEEPEEVDGPEIRPTPVDDF